MNRFSVSVGRALPGMQDVGRNANSNIKPSSSLVGMIEDACTSLGCVKVEVSGEKLNGKRLFRIPSLSDRDWSEKLDDLAGKVDDENPCLFALFRSSSDCLLIKYIPENAKTRVKMLYASSISSIKDVILDLGSVSIEEYNVSTPEELSFDEYTKMKSIEAPLTEAEIARKAEDEAETAGSYSLLARISVRDPIALPGLSKNGPMPAFLLRQLALENGVVIPEGMEEELFGKSSDAADENADAAADEDADAAAESSSRRSSRRSSRSSRSSGKSSRSSRRSSEASRKSSRSKASEEAPKEEVIEEVAEESDDDGEDDPEQYPYTLEDVQRMKAMGELDDNMDASQLELYITSKSFKAAFGMKKSEFAMLPSWKRLRLKKQYKIF
mmetsp:Transcript_7834/g.15563  ORF Transcript_7834/g.15563 Transcript_7834/m.15563 type:complete len:384 (+) Transcript_7834:630-1781(+)|eukprot:CAMPEP_0171497188 /NCGR_PEP_ID=MMETSP0958-20121227/7127_1 /TAXON_ID=87120 /ORGANISM="Aurantiochytrium limacinum, Strain ATCCMYA-1381" /LENGTH=383 /DNA_ID=CAMNT_0012031391 /DNA_START=513 /DNA_END=1664 /DNA_ORIENTATION=+